jgi:hypothetical protein
MKNGMRKIRYNPPISQEGADFVTYSFLLLDILTFRPPGGPSIGNRYNGSGSFQLEILPKLRENGRWRRARRASGMSTPSDEPRSKMEGTKNMNQPDFTKLFFDHFGGKPKRVKYELRLPPHLLHDLVFLTSLVHDARFHRKNIHIRGDRLSVPMSRDCWEIPMTENNELHVAESKLTFTTARDLKWIFMGMNEPDRDCELCIDCLFIDERFRSHHSDRMGFVISGHQWRLEFTLDKMDYSVKLQDLEVPYLYSQKRVDAGE